MKVQALRPPSAPATLQLQVQSSIATYLRRQGRRLEVSRGDGNCLFRLFSFQLTGNQDNHISVRTLLLRFEKLNPSAFQPYLTPINHPTMAEHISHVQKPDVFGTHLEILAIATFYNVPVYYCQLLRGQYSWHCVEPMRSAGVSEFQICQGAHWKRFSHHHISSYHTRSTYITTALSRSLVKSARTYLASALNKSMCQMFCNDDTLFVNPLRNPSFLVYLPLRYVLCARTTMGETPYSRII